MKYNNYLTLLLLVLLSLYGLQRKLIAQNLFLEECFVGGITTGGANALGAVEGSICEIGWTAENEIRSVYAITYRYGRPNDHTIYINDTPINWNLNNQFGNELEEESPASRYFAIHIENVTSSIQIYENILSIDLPQQNFNTSIPNEGYWSVHFVVLYESPEITEPVCIKLYTASQNQESGQNYAFDKPNFRDDTPVLFSIYADRLSDSESDRSRIIINDQTLGDIWTQDLFSQAATGVQGTYYYENSEAFGLNGDTANTRVYKHDGIAQINDFLDGDSEQSIELFRVSNIPIYGGNPHPAFLLTYTPDCEVATEDMPRQYAFCRGDSVQFAGIPGYDQYAWNSSKFLSDSSVTNPWCVADSSRWYTLSMWSDDGGVCPQTIPVHVEVRQTPRANNVFTRSSSCPNPTGEIRFEEMSGTPPFQFTVNGNTQSNPAFTPIGAGVYDISVQDDIGCIWDSTATIIHNPIHEAAFTANPDSGFSPLSVFFDNQSTNASGYIWQINGEDISESENLNYIFDEPGTYQVMLIASRIEETCTDTATALIYVDQGLELVVPNIITPNGDGRNDALVAEARGVASLRWQIYDRWGNVVYSNDATFPGQTIELWNPAGDAHTGQYYIVLTATGENGKTREVKATVTVTR